MVCWLKYQLSAQEVDMHKNYLLRGLFWSSVEYIHAQLFVVPPTYLAIAALNLRIFPLHSSPFLVFLWYQHVPPPEVSVNTQLINIICNTSRIFAARTPTSRQNFDECSRMEVWCSEDMFYD